MSRVLEARVLYISYNGIDEPLVESQVLSYLRGLAGRGARVRLLTFEKSPPEAPEATRAELAGQGIDWLWEPYSGRRGALGTLRDVLTGARHVARLRRAGAIDFVHCRSFLPTLMAWLAGWIAPGPYLYDARGFWAHEKQYKGRIRSSLQFRIARWLDLRLYRDAAAIVSLTHAAARLIEGWVREGGGKNRRPVTVIPTCADLAPYAVPRGALNAEAPLVAYSGSLGSGYLRDEVFAYFVRLRRRLPAARLLVLSRSEREFVLEGAELAGLGEGDFELRSVRPSEIPAELLRCDVGLSFIKPDFAKIASCPTKMAEYLAAGLPVVANTGIGDVDEILEENRVGVVLKAFDEHTLAAAETPLLELLRDPDFPARARDTAERIFSLEQGTERYAQLYASLRATA